MKWIVNAALTTTCLGMTTFSAIAQPLGLAGASSASIAYPAVNGTVIQCPVVRPPSAEQQDAQFETRPRNLDELSAEAKRFMDPSDPQMADFHANQAEQRANDWPYLCRYRDANAALKATGSKPQAVFMGDSITEGWINAHPHFFSDHGYVDRGISGQSSGQMALRFYSDVVLLHPKTVHIMAGTNDIGGATGPLTEDEFVSNVRAMIDMARANGIAVVLASIPPMSRLLPRPEFNVRPVVVALNRRLKNLANEKHVTFVDYYQSLAAADGAFDPGLANDGVHPTRKGYSVMEPLTVRALGHAMAMKQR